MEIWWWQLDLFRSQVDYAKILWVYSSWMNAPCCVDLGYHVTAPGTSWKPPIRHSQVVWLRFSLDLWRTSPLICGMFLFVSEDVPWISMDGTSQQLMLFRFPRWSTKVALATAHAFVDAMPMAWGRRRTRCMRWPICGTCPPRRNGRRTWRSSPRCWIPCSIP